MDNVTLILPIRDDQVLLGMKKRGFGKGWWNGFGGKPKPDETLEEAAVRELGEESGLIARVDDLEKIGVIEFYFPDFPDWNQVMHTYLLKDYQGKPKETGEMRPDLFPIKRLPSEMWPADKHLFPKMLAGEYIEAEVYFIGKGEGVKEIKFRDLSQ